MAADRKSPPNKKRIDNRPPAKNAGEKRRDNKQRFGYVALVRYGIMRFVEPFRARHRNFSPGQWCVVRTDRGVEIGRVLTQASEDERPFNSINEILRHATPEDLNRFHHIDEELEPKEFQFCKERIREHKLPMKLVAVEHLFGGHKIIFYFVADGRVDFRQLVKDLAKEYQTRIEMRQIGVRDEARILADYQHCGRELCCRTFMLELEPVTMKMAKNQKATLDPAKISGRCGRLMCCLRFEDYLYEPLKKNMPKNGAEVMTPDGPGKVVGGDVLQQEVDVLLKSGRRSSYPIADIERNNSQKTQDK